MERRLTKKAWIKDDGTIDISRYDIYYNNIPDNVFNCDIYQEANANSLHKLGHTEDIEEKHNMSIDEMDAYITEHKKIEQRCEIIDTKIEKYEEGEAVIYQNGDRFELGIVKRVCGDDEYFINYHTGDTAARTHARHLHKVTNAYAFHVIRLDPDDNERR